MGRKKGPIGKVGTGWEWWVGRGEWGVGDAWVGARRNRRVGVKEKEAAQRGVEGQKEQRGKVRNMLIEKERCRRKGSK